MFWVTLYTAVSVTALSVGLSPAVVRPVEPPVLALRYAAPICRVFCTTLYSAPMVQALRSLRRYSVGSADLEGLSTLSMFGMAAVPAGGMAPLAYTLAIRTEEHTY